MASFSLDALREQYIGLCEHEVQCVHDEIIKTQMLPIRDFAVKLKIVSDRKVDKSFRGEMDKYLEDLNETTSRDVQINNLIYESSRVTFLRGIAGIGKSVLAKKIAFGWAKRTMYQNFEVCLFFECRELNDYKLYDGKSFKLKDMLHQFITIRLRGLTVEDGKNMLIVIDGVDELFDIKDENSLIYDILDMSKSYGKAKVILTGRPHVESLLHKPRIPIGGCKVVEIMGLGDKDIKEYIEKFTTCIGKERSSEYRDSVIQTINASVYIRPILCVPQFLNAICCVSILTGKKEFRNETELYCWILYLLFKQHVLERENTGVDSLYHNVFTANRKFMLILCKISFELYSKNQIIFTKNDYKPLFDRINKDASILSIAKEFFYGLFADKSDNRERKLQFKQLSLMEYLSAIHICTVGKPEKVIKKFLKNESFEIIRYVCGLYGGVFHDGIVKDLYTCVTGEGRSKGKSDDAIQTRAMSFLKKVLKLIHESKFHREVKFSKSVEFIAQFLSHQFDQADFLKIILDELGSIGSKMDYKPTATEQKMLVRFFKIITDIGIDEKSIKTAFKTIGIDSLYGIYDFALLTVLAYFGYGCSVNIMEMTVDERGMTIIAANLNGCKVLTFCNSVFEDRFVETKYSKCDCKLDILVQKDCRFGQMSFRTFSQWAVLSKNVEFIGDTSISRELWEIFGREIDEAQQRDSRLTSLALWDTAFDESSWESAVKVFVKVKEVRIMTIGISEERWKKLANEIEERKNEDALNLENLFTPLPSSMSRNLERSVRKINN